MTGRPTTGPISLEALGVRVRAVDTVEREVVAAAEQAAFDDEEREFHKRDACLTAEIDALRQVTDSRAVRSVRRDRVRQNDKQEEISEMGASALNEKAQRLEAATKMTKAERASRLLALTKRRITLREAHKARMDIAKQGRDSAFVATGGSSGCQKVSGENRKKASDTSDVEYRDKVGVVEADQSVPTREIHESQRDFDLRTGKISPFQPEGVDIARVQRRARLKSRNLDLGTGEHAEESGSEFEPSDSMPSDSHSDWGDEEDDNDYDTNACRRSGSRKRRVRQVASNHPSSKRARGRKKSAANVEKSISEEEVEEVVLEGGLCVPASIYDRLLDYQKTGVQWMWELHMQQCGGVLADEMGLGKTVQVVAFFAALQHSNRLPGPVLIAAPATVLQQWAREFQAWWPKFHVRILHHAAAVLEHSDQTSRGGSGGNSIDAAHVVRDVVQSKEPSVLITSYEQVRRHDALLQDKFEYVCLDEGHKIRNPDADITLTFKRFSTPRRILVTGTPLQNSLRELWSLFDFVFPGRLGTLVVFETQFSAPIALGGYANATKSQVHTAHRCAVVLRDLVSPYLLRRMKRDVAVQLPDKEEHVLFCRLSPEQREAYLSFLGSKTVRQVLAGKLNLLYAITVLRKICNHVDVATASPEWEGPRWTSVKEITHSGGASRGKASANEPRFDTEEEHEIRSTDGDYGNWNRAGKMQVLNTVLRAWHKTDSRALVFSQTRTMLNILEQFAKDRGYSYRRMDGQTAVGRRMQLIDEYNSDKEIFLFFLTTKVGGLGVNLTGADRVLLFDPDWNPSTDLQARERAWRIGQTKPVTVYRLITSGTIEEKMYHRQIYKQFLGDKVLSDPRQRRFFKKKDMKDLFALGDGAERGTETGDIFASSTVCEVVKHSGSGNEMKKSSPPHVASRTANPDSEAGREKSREDSGAQLLKDLFDSADAGGGLHSAINHDAIVGAGMTDVDTAIVQHEADVVAKKAVEELQRSSRERRRQNVSEPTWTGRSGTAGIPRLSSGKRIVSFATETEKSSMLLQRLRERSGSAPSVVGMSPEGRVAENMLANEIVVFLRNRGGSAPTDDVIDYFGDRVGADGHRFIVFKAMLKQVAVRKKEADKSKGSVWYLRKSLEAL